VALGIDDAACSRRRAVLPLKASSRPVTGGSASGRNEAAAVGIAARADARHPFAPAALVARPLDAAISAATLVGAPTNAPAPAADGELLPSAARDPIAARDRPAPVDPDASSCLRAESPGRR
jgi:hypothetical protein